MVVSHAPLTSVSCASMHSTSRAMVPPPESASSTTPSGPSPLGMKRTARSESTCSLSARLMDCERTAKTRFRKITLRQRSGGVFFLVVLSQTKRLAESVNCLCFGSKATSFSLKTLSCKCVEMIERSSVSSASNLRPLIVIVLFCGHEPPCLFLIVEIGSHGPVCNGQADERR
ncbi:hypothetical protein AT6N2_C1983 [Agrobacterium tumefaciens]|nr:hypothetical protein AT6N2_C1983 [Agrobacterium tumefaciens]